MDGTNEVAVVPNTEAAAIWLAQNTMGGFDSGTPRSMMLAYPSLPRKLLVPVTWA